MKTKNLKKHQNNKGLSLIECVVVIAIIAILAAILFPVFAQAREKARQASCLSNVKQLGTAIQLYVDDYDETFPWVADITGTWGLYLTEYAGYPCQKYVTMPDWGTPGYYITWMDEIYPYVKNMKMFECPSLEIVQLMHIMHNLREQIILLINEEIKLG